LATLTLLCIVQAE